MRSSSSPAHLALLQHARVEAEPAVRVEQRRSTDAGLAGQRCARWRAALAEESSRRRRGSRRHGFARKFSGEISPLTGVTVRVSRYALKPKTKNSPGLFSAPLGAMPPPSVKFHDISSRSTAKVPYPQVHASGFCWVIAKRPRSNT